MSTTPNENSSVNTNSTLSSNEQDTVNVESTNQSQEQVETERLNYEVVLYAKYGITSDRPSKEEIESYFGRYGTVHHVKYPENKNIAFVFLTQLNTDVEHGRTRTVLSQIIREMKPEERFFVTVARSNNNNNTRGNYRGNQYRSNYQYGRGHQPYYRQNYNPNQYYNQNYNQNQYRSNYYDNRQTRPEYSEERPRPLAEEYVDNRRQYVRGSYNSSGSYSRRANNSTPEYNSSESYSRNDANSTASYNRSSSNYRFSRPQSQQYRNRY